jgi:hypothetical protein
MDEATIERRRAELMLGERLYVQILPNYFPEHEDWRETHVEFSDIYRTLDSYDDERLLATRVLLHMDGKKHATLDRVVNNILQYRNSTVSEDHGHPTAVQAPDPVDPDLPR